ncbi:MAG: efflux RND transporter periplasmic adaptor subunit [Flavobacteriales bacterium]|nr:efflux RND transporter periplasmic adaptor subunit [Flavobacteriales bacterium]
MKSKKIIIGIGTVLILVFIIAAGVIMATPPDVVLQGQVEAKHIKISSKIPGRISHILIGEGDKVKVGDTLIKISTPELDAKLIQAESARNAAKSQSDKAMHGARKEQIQGAYNLWQKAKAGREVYEKTYIRVKNLHNDGVVPTQKLDEVTAKYKASVQDEEAAHSMYLMAKKGARDEDKAGAAALVDQASGVIQELDSYLSEANVKSPIDGEVASIISEEGELVNTGFPIVTVVDLNDVWFVFNIREDFLAKLKMGEEVVLSVPALDRKDIKAKIYFINPLGDFATWKATKVSGEFDMKTFEVKARPIGGVEDLRPGMTVLMNWNKQ